MPERAPNTPKAQVTSGGAGHLDNGWAGGANPGVFGASEPDGGPAASEAAIRTLAQWFTEQRQQLRTMAETIEIAVMEQLRIERQHREAGRSAARLGLRIRAPRRAGGSFTIEWFQVQRRGRTQYIPRGQADGYPRAAFVGALPWERGIALQAEQRLGEIRRRLRLMKDIERRVADFAAIAVQPAEPGPAADKSEPAAGATHS